MGESMNARVLLLIAVLASGAPDALLRGVPAAPARAQQQDPADVAWTDGAHDEARALYAQRVAADSTDVRALHRLGLLLAWNSEHREALRLMDRLMMLAPGTEARRDRANIRAWSGDYDGALRDIDALLREDPASVDALHARARFLSWAGRLPAAADAYRAMLERDPADADAWRGLARVASWAGDLAAGERLWRSVLAANPDDVDARVGLSQVLRWRGQTTAALEEAEAAARLAPQSRDAQVQLDWARAAFAPRVAPSVAAEFDSDENRLLTTALMASAYVGRRVALSAHGYIRRATDGREAVGPGLDAVSSRAASLGVRADLGRGWIAGATGGLVDRGGARASDATWGASFALPAWWPVSAAVAYAHGVLDGTARLIERGVTTDELTATAAARLGPAVRVEAAGSLARYEGSVTNDRVLGRLGLEIRAGSMLRIRPRVSAFTFDRRAGDGYFDPDFYGLAELGVGVERYRGAWSLTGEVAPGAQQVGSDGGIRGALALRARVGYTMAPGREIGVSVGMSNLGIERFEAASAGYRYSAAVVSGAWRF
jgi:tetratricopeptide (TPR) repeat protein